MVQSLLNLPPEDGSMEECTEGKQKMNYRCPEKASCLFSYISLPSFLFSDSIQCGAFQQKRNALSTVGVVFVCSYFSKRPSCPPLFSKL